MSAFDHKVPPPFVCLAFAVLMGGVAYFSSSIPLPGIFRWSLIAMFLIAGMFYGPPAIRTFIRLKTTIDPVNIANASQVVSSGPFAYSRNPMYVGMLMLLLAWAAYLSVAWTALGPILFFAYITRFQIMPEEKAMEAKFGQAYLAYKKRVRRWI